MKNYIVASEVLKILGKNLRRLRTDLGLSMRELADKLEINYTSLSNYEHGRNLPSADVLDRFVDFYKVTHADLFTADSKAKPSPKQQRVTLNEALEIVNKNLRGIKIKKSCDNSKAC
jgi:transcriptional regulator with XRE-family HTH domain